MKEAELKEIEARAQAATEGLQVEKYSRNVGTGYVTSYHFLSTVKDNAYFVGRPGVVALVQTSPSVEPYDPMPKADLEFWEEARGDVLRLVARVRELEGKSTANELSR